MTKKSNLLAICLILTIGLFTYLSIHHFALKIGLGTGDSLCSISSRINCDAAATSSASEIVGIPIAVLGATFNLIILSFVFFFNIKIIEASNYLKFTLRAMLVSGACASVFYGALSLFVIKVICPFCLATYLFSIVNLFLGWRIVHTHDTDFSIKNYFGEYRSHLIALALVPAFSWMITGTVEKNYGLDELHKYIPSWIASWQAGTEYSFDSNTGLSNGVLSPKYTIVEFADYKCPHCKVAFLTLDAFLKGQRNVLFIYKPYPLDGICNEKVPQKSDGSRCAFAGFTLCAEKIAKKGWDIHHWLFEKQEEFASVTDAKTLLPQIESKFGLDTKQMAECADSEEIFSEIKKSTEEGNRANVKGTPSIYINGKILQGAHILEVLKQATSN